MFSKKRISEIVLLMLISGVWFVIGWLVHGRIAWQNPDDQLIEQVRQAMLKNYIDNMPDSRELTYAALRGMVQKISDPYAAFMDPFITERFRADFNGDSGVIGLFPERVNSQFVTTVVLPGGSAEKAGLQVGDVIRSVDGIPLDETTTSVDVTLLLRGPVGTPAKLVVQRGEEELAFEPVRKVRSVTTGAAILDGNIAYFAQHTFTANSPEEVAAVLRKLLAEEPGGLIWDLRSNGGGSMEAAEQIISFFIKEGLVFQIALKDGEIRQIEATGEAIAPLIPLVILAGEHTFSAAETAVTAIQDHKRGTVIGDTTYGKGTVQTTLPMPENTAVQFTIAHWLSPNGIWIDGRGAEPDIRVLDDPATEEDEILEFALEYLKENQPD